MKFCTQNDLINISVEFEDEKDPSRNGWVIEKIVIIGQIIPEGEYMEFSKKNIFSELFTTYIDRLSFCSTHNNRMQIRCFHIYLRWFWIS